MFMKRLLIVLLGTATFTLVILLTGSLPAQAESDNPFGFETNTHPLEYEHCKKEPGSSALRGHGYKCRFAPRPHPDVKEYTLQFVEGIGLCFIGAMYERGNSKGTLQDLKDQIANKYGPSTEVKYFEPGTILGENDPIPRQYAWNPKTGFKGFGDVKAIGLKHNHNNRTAIYFFL